MTLRWRYYLAVVPLLIGLGVASALVLAHLVRSEATWGMQQRAEGIAASIAEFLPLLKAADEAGRQRQLEDVARRLGPATLAVHAWPWTAEPARIAYPGAGFALPVPTEALLLELSARDASWRHEPAAGELPSRIVGHALARDAAGMPYAVVTVIEQDDTLAQSLQALQGELWWIFGMLLLLGCAIAEWLTRSLQRELGTLVTAASELEAVGRVQQWTPGRIQEINDLGGTLQTLGSLLADGVQRIRQGFFEAETIPTRQSVALHVQRRHLQRLRQRPLPEGVAWCALGVPVPQHVLCWQADAAGWVAVLGVLEVSDAADPLESALYAQALGRQVLNAESDSPASRVLQANAVLQRIGWRAGDAVRLKLGRADGAGSAERLAPGRHLYGTVDAEALQVARMYLAQTGDRPLSRVISELESLLGARYSGFLWAFETGVAADA